MKRSIVPMLLVLASCGGDKAVNSMPDSGMDMAADLPRVEDMADMAVDQDVVLQAAAGESFYATVGESVMFDGSESTGATAYTWNFGDGESAEEASPTHTYTEVGRYQAVLTVRDDTGATSSDSVVVTVTPDAVFEPRQSSTVATAVVDDVEFVAVVSPDSNELVIIRRTGDEFALESRKPTCSEPRAVARWQDGWAVSCYGSDQIQYQPDFGAIEVIELGWGVLPFGVITVGGALFVALQGPGELAKIGTDGSVQTVAAITDARHLAALTSDRIAVSRWRSAPDKGELAILNSDLTPVEVVELAFDDQVATDTETGGVPTYLGPLAVAPDGVTQAVASLQANINQGLFLNGDELTHEFAVRAVVSFLEGAIPSERTSSRKQFDDRGFASTALFSRRGDFLYVVMPGNRVIERFDMFSRSESGTILDTGFAPAGIALTADDQFLLVDSYLSRELRVYRTADFNGIPQPVDTIQIPSSEPLSEEVLLGKRLFNDSRDLRLTQDGYIACANCHLDGLGDNQTWDFTDRGEGLRNTTSLLGRAGDGDGPIHWSGNFDEVQDFEHDIRGPFAGTGLMDDADWNTGTVSETLGDPKAGISADLDALAAYLATFDRHLRSPYRNADGSLTADAEAGKVIFESAETGCTTCHSGARLTDSQFVTPTEALLHDVGTLGSGSGERLGETLTGIDTPTLHGLWNAAPYLHDGSAATLKDVITRNTTDTHGVTSQLTDTEIDQLVAYLLSLEG